MKHLRFVEAEHIAVKRQLTDEATYRAFTAQLRCVPFLLEENHTIIESIEPIHGEDDAEWSSPDPT